MTKEREPADKDEVVPFCRIAFSEAGAIVFRNNTGMGFYRNRDGSERPIRFGLCVGSSDIIGFYPVVITPAMIGRTVAVFVAAEGKFGTGRASAEQQKFINAVQRAGGIAGVVRRQADARALLDGFALGAVWGKA